MNVGGLTKKIDPQVLQALSDAKLIEQVPWKQMPKRYKELTGEGIDWRTIQRHLSENMGAALLPGRVTSQVRELIEKAYAEANAVTIGLRVLVAKYQQFSLFHERYLRSLAVSAADREDPDLAAGLPTPLTNDELQRMDQLAKDISDFLFKGMAAMKEGSSYSTELFQRAFGAGAVVAAEALVEAGEEGSALALVEAVGKRSTEMLENMNARHRKEGMGHWRPQAGDSGDAPEDE